MYDFFHDLKNFRDIKTTLRFFKFFNISIQLLSLLKVHHSVSFYRNYCQCLIFYFYREKIQLLLVQVMIRSEKYCNLKFETFNLTKHFLLI
jgi:hypothetical protein